MGISGDVCPLASVSSVCGASGKELCSLQKRADNSAFLLQISGYSGDAGDSWGASHNLNGMAFTTRDNDNDNRGGGNCAVDYSGVVVIPTIPIISDGDKLQLSFIGVKTVVIRILLKLTTICRTFPLLKPYIVSTMFYIYMYVTSG